MSRSLRICVVAACPVPLPRGTPIRVTRLAEALARLGHSVNLVTYGFGIGQLAAGVEVNRIVRIPRLDSVWPGPSIGKLLVLDPLLALRLKRLLISKSFDVIHAHHYEGLLVAKAVAGRRTPVVYDAHTILASELPSYGRWFPAAPKRRLGHTLDRLLPSRAEFVVAVSQNLRDHLVSTRSTRADRIVVIGNGVELEHRPRVEPAEGPNAEGGTITYAGNLAEYQGIPYLLEAFRTVLDQRPAARLQILTESSFQPFEPLARELAVLHRIEIRSVPFAALHRQLSLSHVTVNPRPVCDGVPQKNLNYMAASTALVAFSHSLHPCKDRESGVAVERLSGKALGDAILSVLAQPLERARLGRAARDELEQNYTWERQARKLTALYERILNR